jgi:hypothetical protein
VVGEPLDVLGEPVGMEALQRLGDAPVHVAALRLEEGPVRHLVGEHVGEGVFEIGKKGRLVEESGRLEMGRGRDGHPRRARPRSGATERMGRRSR